MNGLKSVRRKVQRTGAGKTGETQFASPRYPLAPKQISIPLVNFTSVADVMKKDATEPHVKFVNYAIITHAQFAFRPALQSLVWEGLQARAHFIYFALHSFADGRRKLVEGAGKGGRPDLERGGHESLGLARDVMASGDFAARFVEPSFHLIGQFKLVVKKVIDPRADFFNLSTG